MMVVMMIMMTMMTTMTTMTRVVHAQLLPPVPGKIICNRYHHHHHHHHHHALITRALCARPVRARVRVRCARARRVLGRPPPDRVTRGGRAAG